MHKLTCAYFNFSLGTESDRGVYLLKNCKTDVTKFGTFIKWHRLHMYIYIRNFLFLCSI